jgi:hypothetical protein
VIVVNRGKKAKWKRLEPTHNPTTVTKTTRVEKAAVSLRPVEETH